MFCRKYCNETVLKLQKQLVYTYSMKSSRIQNVQLVVSLFCRFLVSLLCFVPLSRALISLIPPFPRVTSLLRSVASCINFLNFVVSSCYFVASFRRVVVSLFRFATRLVTSTFRFVYLTALALEGEQV